MAQSNLWDVGTSRAVVSKDIHISFLVVGVPPATVFLVPRSSMVHAENSASAERAENKSHGLPRETGRKPNDQNSDFAARPDSLDNVRVSSKTYVAFFTDRKMREMIDCRFSVSLPSCQNLVRFYLVHGVVACWHRISI